MKSIADEFAGVTLVLKMVRARICSYLLAVQGMENYMTGFIEKQDVFNI